MNNFDWVKSSYSGGESANCVQIAALPGGGRAVRDSKDPAGVVLLLSPAQWLGLVEQGLVKQGLVKQGLVESAAG
jgi:uncharacterized protein DUF397/GLTT repeat-containing protein